MLRLPGWLGEVGREWKIAAIYNFSIDLFPDSKGTESCTYFGGGSGDGKLTTCLPFTFHAVSDGYGRMQTRNVFEMSINWHGTVALRYTEH